MHGMTLLGPKSLYDALLVDQTATLDEIKLAFKKRALQVHPDKGGSKEAFHLVYQALETLADPEARKIYDHSLSIRKSGNMQQQRPGDVRGKKTTVRKHCQSTAKEAQSTRRAPNPKCKPRPRGNTGSEPSPQAPQSKQTKLLIKIRDLLKQFPRDMRNDAISKEFSQKQRLILEKWMVDSSSQAHGATEAPLTSADLNSGATSTDQRSVKDTIRDVRGVTLGDGCSSLAVQPFEVFEPMRFAIPGGAGIRSMPFVPATARKRSRNKSKTDNNDKKPKVSSSGCIWKVNDHYRAGIKFDALELHTGQCDLQTALEYLVILTSVKQKVQDGNRLPTRLEERLHAALVASAKEHGRNFQDLQVRYAVNQRASVFIGQQLMLKSPCVRSVETLKKIRVFLDPFRAYARRNLKGARMFWQYSPAHLEDAWERFQEAVAKAWEIAGADSTKFMTKVRARYEASATSRQRNLQSWERQHMAKEDKNKHRPRSLQDRGTKRLEGRERRHMARHDKSKLHPLHTGGPKFSGRKCAAEGVLRHKMLTLKKFLARWERLLKIQARFADKEYRKALRLRKLQQKKDTEKRRRQEVLNQKRVREEERLRRESLRKRMKSSDFMDNIPWI